MSDSLSLPLTARSSEEAPASAGGECLISLREEISGLKSQLLSYEQQVYQHSLTIVNLENKLLESFSHSSDRTKVDSETMTETCVEEHPTPQTPDMEKIPARQEADKTGPAESHKSRDASQIRYLQRRIFSLSERLEQAEARLERSKVLTGKLQEALNLKSTLVSKQHSELLELRSSLPGVRSALYQVQEEVSSISTSLIAYNDAQSRFSPITELAAKCSQESHTQTIERQAQAIAAMRAHVRQLEAANQLVPTHREAVTEVGALREELRRAKSALEGTDIAYLVQRREAEEASYRQLLEERGEELEREREASSLTRTLFSSTDETLRELVVILSSKFYNLYRLDFKMLSNLSQAEMEAEMESRKKQISVFSHKLSEYEDEILSRHPAIDAENVKEIERLNQVIIDYTSKIESKEEENLSLRLQNDLLEKQELYSPKKERFHSCLFTQDMVDTLLEKERKRCKELVRKKNKELSILRKALSHSHSD